MRIGFLALLLCALTAPYGMAQSPNTDILGAIEESYRQLRYEEAEQTARSALDNYGEFTVEQLAEIHTFLALIAYNRGELGEARLQFLSALQLRPSLELDGVLVPPKIQSFFADIRSEAASDSYETSQAATRYVLVRDARPEAALRSMLVPGWGQLYKGHDVKAYAFVGLFGAAVGGAVLAHARRADAQQRYEAASTIDEADGRYDTYNAWHRARNGLIQGAAVVWAVSYVDALLSGSSRTASQPVSGHAAPSGISPHAAHSSISLRAAPSSISLRVRF